MNRTLALLLLSAGLINTAWSQPQLIQWEDNTPSSLKPFQNNASEVAALAKHQILIYAHPSTSVNLPTNKKQRQAKASFTTSAIVLQANAEQVGKLLADYEHYVGLYPTIKSAKILQQQNQHSLVQYKISIPTPIPVLNFHETIVFQHQREAHSISSLVIDAPIPYGLGKLEWFPLENNQTLLTLTQWGDLNQPKGFVFSKILNAVPEAKLGIPSGTGGFILESIRLKFDKKAASTLKPGQFPQDQWTAAQLNRIAQVSRASQQPVSLIHAPTTVPYQHGAEKMRFVTTYHYFPQSSQQLSKWTQPTLYSKLFPRQLKSVTVQEQNGSQLADFKVNLGLGVINIPFNFKLNFQYPQAHSNSFFAQGGDLKYIKGEMAFNAHGSGTLMKMTNAAKIDEKAPFLLRAARSLPYNDLLPTLGANTVFALKVQSVEK